MPKNNIFTSDAERICSSVNLKQINECAIIVTGASGLVGTSFTSTLKHLIKMGLKLKVFLLVHSDPPRHLNELITSNGMNIIKLDLADTESFSKLPKADIIIHSAGYAQPMRFMKDPISTIQINTSATIALLNHLKINGNFLYVSSSEVYSDNKKKIFDENDIGFSTPYHPRASYIEGKKMGETICYSYRLKGVHATSIRLGDTYGPGTKANDNRAINTFIRKAITEGKLRLLDAGLAVRTYCYISDALEFMWKILLYGSEPVYNVGGKSSTTIYELAKIIGDLTNTQVIVPENHNGVVGSPNRIVLDTMRAEKEFNKTEYVSLKSGLINTIEWQQKNLYS